MTFFEKLPLIPTVLPSYSSNVNLSSKKKVNWLDDKITSCLLFILIEKNPINARPLKALTTG